MSREVIISNSNLNSYGFRVLTGGINIEQYKRNPVLLFMHERGAVIGRIDSLRFDNDNLIGTPVFDENDAEAAKIKAKWNSGFLRMVSAAFEPVELSGSKELLLPGQKRQTVVRSKLVEVSVVDIGANDDALMLYKNGTRINLATGLDAILPEIQAFDDNNNDNLKMKTIALKLGLPETAAKSEILTCIGSLQTQVEQANALMLSAIASAVDAAVSEKKITADKKEHFIALGKTMGIAHLTETLILLAPVKRPTDYLRAGGKTEKPEELKWGDLTPDMAEKIKAEEPDKYIRLYKDNFGFAPDLNS